MFGGYIRGLDAVEGSLVTVKGDLITIYGPYLPYEVSWKLLVGGKLGGLLNSLWWLYKGFDGYRRISGDYITDLEAVVGYLQTKRSGFQTIRGSLGAIEQRWEAI